MWKPSWDPEVRGQGRVGGSQEGQRGWFCQSRYCWGQDLVATGTVTVSIQEWVLVWVWRTRAEIVFYSKQAKRPRCEEKKYSCKCSALQQRHVESLNSLVGRVWGLSTTQGIVRDCTPELLLTGCENMAPPEERQPVTAWNKTSVFAVQGVTSGVTT